MTEREKLETALDEAVKAENYEKAAQVRDALRNLKPPERPATAESRSSPQSMSLQQRLTDEIKAAMFAKDADRLGTLRLLKSALGYAQIEKKSESTSDADFVALVQKEVKKRRDSVEQYEKGGRPELAEKGEAGNRRARALFAAGSFRS